MDPDSSLSHRSLLQHGFYAALGVIGLASANGALAETAAAARDNQRNRRSHIE